MRKRITAIILALSLLSGLLVPLKLEAKDNYNGTGLGNQGGVIAGDLTWSTKQQGYRLTMVDKNGAVVSKPVDIVYSPVPTNNIDEIWNCKVEPYKSRGKNQRFFMTEVLKSDGLSLANPPPMAMGWNGGAVAQGQALRQWMLAGECSIKDTPTNSSTSTGKAHYTSGSPIIDQMIRRGELCSSAFSTYNSSLHTDDQRSPLRWVFIATMDEYKNGRMISSPTD